MRLTEFNFSNWVLWVPRSWSIQETGCFININLIEDLRIFGKPVFFSSLWKAEEAASDGSSDGGSSSNGVDALTSKKQRLASEKHHFLLWFLYSWDALEGAIHSWGVSFLPINPSWRYPYRAPKNCVCSFKTQPRSLSWLTTFPKRYRSVKGGRMFVYPTDNYPI